MSHTPEVFEALPVKVASLGRYPLGATLLPEGGVHFGLYSKHAQKVELCLFDPQNAQEEICRICMERDDEDVWHAVVSNARVGTLYGYRVYGEWKPQWGWWFNPRKLLLDPYAKAIEGDHQWNESMQNLTSKMGPEWHNNAAMTLKSVVVDDSFDWQGVDKPGVLWEDLVIYEMHVRGFSKINPALPEEVRGTYAGLAHPVSIDYLKRLGVSAVQLLPVHQHLDDGFLLNKQLTNYWGYNTVGFFAPHPEYAAASDPQGRVNEFKFMVRELHRAGIEVILDVVYNHTAEGDENGPLLFLRGIDNPAYYLLNEESCVVNYTGTGNTINAASTPALRMIMDSLRYWVQEMQIDGFRFDLGATMGRQGAQFNPNSPFFMAISQDPVLNKVKLIAEPWDIGPDGYQVGGFPKPWHELNGRYRDTTRRFWCGDGTSTAEFAKRLCGSQDIYEISGRGPLTSVNFITSHDGFTLRDLWSYNSKHNEENGENNNDGDNHNHSWNAGVEGETDDPEIKALRRRLARGMLATMFCSLGVPFLTAGDERWRTQRGNNNAYCQDNEISWLDWAETEESASLLSFVKQLIRFRQEHAVFKRSSYFSGVIHPNTGEKDVEWFSLHGLPMTHEAWHDEQTHFFAGLFGAAKPGEGCLLLLFNNSVEEVLFPIPEGKSWRKVFDTSLESPFEITKGENITDAVTSPPRSVVCLVSA